MRRFLILAALAAMVLATAEAQAARKQVAKGNGTKVVRGNNPFARLMELERRKNAALFGGLRR